MSEHFPEQPRFANDPELNRYYSPADPYDDRVQQFVALRDLGYPVDLKMLSASEIDLSNYGDDSHDYLNWRVARFNTWTVPVVLNPEFEKFVEDPDVPGDIEWSTDEDVNDLMGGHAMKIISDIDQMDISGLGYYVQTATEDNPHIPVTSDGMRLNAQILQSAFVAAYERAKQVEADGFNLTGSQKADLEHDALYVVLKSSGIRAANPEQLGALMFDYYRLAEKINPDFKSFKR